MDKRILRQVHRIMDKGLIPACNNHQSKGLCTCCIKNTTRTGSLVIDLFDGEQQLLMSSGYVGNLIFNGNTLACTRHDSGEHMSCVNKPLDCKMYPLFPLEVSFSAPVYHITMLGCAPKCPLMFDASYFENGTHIVSVCKSAILLEESGSMDGFRNLAVGDGFMGYKLKLIIAYDNIHNSIIDIQLENL